MTKTKSILTALLFSTAFLGTSLSMAQESAAAPGGNSLKVERLSIPVTLSDGNTYDVVGYLYYHGSYHHRPLQILAHGITYTHEYWDMPDFNGHTYSYARYMAERKYAVLALDLPGTGESSRPDGDFLNLAQTASSVHQVVEEMRTPGGVFAHPFHSVALVGHSYGAVVDTLVEATYGDADALVNTSFGFTPHPSPVDPAAIAALLGTPYISLPAAFRSALFYYAPNADPAVIDWDNTSISDTFTRGQFVDLLGVFGDPSLVGIGGVTCPVFAQFGEHDVLHPPSLAASDAALYTSAESVTTATVPGAGHALNGHTTNTQGWAQIDAWLRATLGSP